MNTIKKVGLLLLSLMVSATAFVGCGEDATSGDSSVATSSAPTSSTEVVSSEETSSVEASSEEASSVEASSEETSSVETSSEDESSEAESSSEDESSEAESSSEEESSEEESSSEEASSSEEEESSEESSSSHEHAYTQATYNETHHWMQCSCGDVEEEIEHRYEVGGFDETNHWTQCVCGAKVDVETHEFALNESDDVNHWTECACGAKSGEEAHDYALNKSDDTNHWTECACGAKTEDVAHDYAIAKFEGMKHWLECVCGAKTEEEAHDYAQRIDETLWKACDCGAKILAVKVGETNVDLTDVIEAGSTYMPVLFEGLAGTYVLSTTGIRAVSLTEDETLGDALTGFTLAEGESLVFALAMGEDYSVAGSVEIEFIYNPEINENAVKAANAMFREGRSVNDNIAVGDATGVVAPNGFTTVSCVVSDENNFGNKNTMMPHGYDDTLLGKYSEVWFAVKVVNGYVDMPNSEGTTENVWVYFHLTQTSASVWTIEAVVNGQTVCVMEEQSGTEIDVNAVIQPTNALATILYGKARNSTDGGYVMIRPSVDSGAIVSVYSTEVMGYEKPFDPGVSADAEKALTSALLDCSITDVAETSVTAPAGFESVTKYVANENWGSSYALSAVAYNDADLTAYEELWFAVKTVNAAIRIWPNGSTGYEATPDGEWVYFHLTQNDDGTWTVEMTWQGAEQMVVRTLENQTGSTVKTILYDVGAGTNATDGYSIWIRSNNADAYTSGAEFYSTEVRGVLKATE